MTSTIQGNNLSDCHDVTKAKRLIELKNVSSKSGEKKNQTGYDDKGNSELNNLSTNCTKCKGDTNQSEKFHIEDLCPVDKKRIRELIERLADSTKARQSAENIIVILKTEVNTWKNCYTQFERKNESEKSQLQLQLVQTTAELNQLRVQMSESLELISRQIKAQETQFSQLTITSKSLVQEKFHLEKALMEANAKLDEAEKKLEMVRKKAQTENRMLHKEHTRNVNVKTEDQACQTQTSLEPLPKSEPNIGSERDVHFLKTKDDLEELSMDGKLIQDLFFKHPTVVENEPLELTLPSLF